MLSYRLLPWIVFLLATLTRCTDEPLVQGFNCVHLYDDVRVQLNTHITRHIRIHTMSPDGSYLVGSIEHAEDSELFIEEVATGQRVTLQEHVVFGHQIVWSPDSQSIFYTWIDSQGKYHANLVTVQGVSIGETISDELPRLLSFSPDGRYFSVAEPSVGVSIFAVNDLDHRLLTGPFDAWAYENVRWFAGQYWSWDSGRLAYITASELVLMNVRTHSLQHISLPSPIPRASDSINMTISWSPDGQRLLIQHWDLDHDQYGVYLFEVTASALQGISVNFPDSSSRDMGPIRWISRTELVYLKRNATRHDEIKRYDLKTQRSTVMLPDVECAIFNDDSFTFAYREGSYVTAEARTADGFSLLFKRTFQAEGQVLCGWRRTPYAQVTRYSITGQGEVVRIATHDSKLILWIANSLPVAQANDIPWGYKTSDNRFVILWSPHSDEVRILDLKTHQRHLLPDDINSLDPNKWWYWSSLDIDPAPDEASWLVLVNGKLYRYWLLEDRWEPAPITRAGSTIEVRDVLWSPDGQRYAVLSDMGLYVYDANNHFRWSLGTFAMMHFFRAGSMHWTQCGDALAPLRDRLAAERP